MVSQSCDGIRDWMFTWSNWVLLLDMCADTPSVCVLVLFHCPPFFILLFCLLICKQVRFLFSGDSEIIWTCLYALGSDISGENYESITVFRL